MARARPQESEALPEADRLEGFAHPRETSTLFGQDAGERVLAEAFAAGRMHHAWLLTGRRGIGKATLAYRLAKHALAKATERAGGTLSLAIAAAATTNRQVLAQSHPGLLVVRRPYDPRSRRFATSIPVDEVRRLRPFLGLTGAQDGFRVVIVDSADELNGNAANALLKALEEPPERTLFLLIASEPSRILPTIRSRCQRLDLKPLEESAIASTLAKFLPETSAEERASLSRLSEGSLGLALRLGGGEGLELARDADALLDARGAPDVTRILALAERVARAQDGLSHFGEFLARGLSRRIRARAEAGSSDYRAVVLWEEMHGMYERAVGVHMEPRQTVIASALKIADARRRGAV